MPGFQGFLLRGRWAMVEFMTFDSNTLGRPGLLMRKDSPHEEKVFDLFTKQFEDIGNRCRPRERPEKPPA
jgi:hypothetical protein